MLRKSEAFEGIRLKCLDNPVHCDYNIFQAVTEI